MLLLHKIELSAHADLGDLLSQPSDVWIRRIETDFPFPSVELVGHYDQLLQFIADNWGEEVAQAATLDIFKGEQ
jgi:hypothetical protein